MKKSIFIIPFLYLLSLGFATAQNTEDTKVQLSDAQLKDFRDQAQGAISALADYVEIIGNKDIKDVDRRRKSIDLAVNLFMTDSNVVEVSNSINSEISRIPIRTYFNKLMLLPYAKVTIKWYDVYLSNNFILGKDGRYYGTATVYQKFTGVTGIEFGGRAYSDVTKKNIQIIVQKNSAQPGGIEASWRLYLGDINVQETKNQ